MVNPWKKPARNHGQFIVFSELDRLEAPDETFIGHRDILTRSKARYYFVAQHLSGAILDVGCGRGYGFGIMQSYGRLQVGIDVSYNFLHDAQMREPDRLLALASGDRLPFAEHSFDSIISFEVIEHIKDDVAFLRDLRRLARDNAFIAISTPNKLISSRNVDIPLNPFHVREYVAEEFYRLLRQEFSSVTVYGQHDNVRAVAWTNRWIDRVPMHWKYVLPTHVQGVLSVALRARLRLDDCRFTTEDLDTAHSFVALCRI